MSDDVIAAARGLAAEGFASSPASPARRARHRRLPSLASSRPRARRALLQRPADQGAERPQPGGRDRRRIVVLDIDTKPARPGASHGRAVARFPGYAPPAWRKRRAAGRTPISASRGRPRPEPCRDGEGQPCSGPGSTSRGHNGYVLAPGARTEAGS